MLYILCGISGVGKTTLLNALLQQETRLGQLITYTTRLPRPGEEDHVDYHFTSEPSFQAAVEAGHLVCPIVHRGAHYATALDDLRASAHKKTLTVLRPDKISELQAFTPAPLLGIYVMKPGCEPHSEDDHIIFAHQHLCSYHIMNIPGDLDQAVFQILALMMQEVPYAHR
jgi:guanylate kinase